MKASVAILAALSVVLCYEDFYDKLDIDKILADEALFTAYIDCTLDKGPCEAEHSADFKKLIPEIIATNCEKCSPIQKERIRKIVKTLIKKKPAEFVEFKKKYDPAAKYEKDFTAFVLAE